MNDRLKMAIRLLQEASDDMNRLNEMKSAIEAIDKDAEHYWKLVCDIEKSYMPKPVKQVINDKMRIARRMIAEEYLK